jgi:hypothetical protein
MSSVFLCINASSALNSRGRLLPQSEKTNTEQHTCNSQFDRRQWWCLERSRGSLVEVLPVKSGVSGSLGTDDAGQTDHQRTVEIVTPLLNDIVRVAEQLDERKTLSYEEVCEIVNQPLVANEKNPTVTEP